MRRALVARQQREAVRPARGKLREHLAQIGVGLALGVHDDLHVVAQHLRERLRQEIEAAPRRELARGRDQRDVRAEREADRRLKLALAARLAAEVDGIEARRNRRVGRGVPHGDVHAVEDADDVLAARAQHAVEAMAALRRADLLRVGWRDGRHAARGEQPALEQVDRAVELEPLRREVLPRQAERLHRGLREAPLLREVVDGQQRRHRRERGVALRHVDRERGGPIVRVQHIEARLALLDQLERAERQERKALRVERERVALAVDVRDAAEELLVAEEEQIDAARRAAVVELTRDLLAAELNLDLHQATSERARRWVDVGVERRQDGDLVAETAQRLRERTAHVGEAGRFGEGRDLGGHEEDFHGAGSYTKRGGWATVLGVAPPRPLARAAAVTMFGARK